MLQYKQYKAINLPWLSKIPAHWNIQRNKTVFSEMKEEVGENAKQYRLLSLTLNGIIPRDMEAGGKFPESFDKYKIVKPGYMAFCLFDLDETPRTVGLSQYDGMLAGAYTIMQVHDINPRYAYYYYLSLDNQKKLRPLYTGLRKTINVNTFQSAKLPVPPCDEQEQIVRFLDWKVSAINRLIVNYRRQITLLESIIQKRIDETIAALSVNKMQRLKFVARCNMRTLDESTSPDYTFQYVDISSVNAKKGITNYEPMQFSNAPSRARRVVKRNDIIVSTVRTYLRAIAKIEYDNDVIVSTGFAVLTPHKVDSKYLEYCFKSSQFCDEVVRRSIGIAYPSINTPDLMSIAIPIPSPEMQREIINSIEANAKKIDTAIENRTRRIETLQDFKARLISDVVTGKIDVRGVEVPEYETVEEEVRADMDEEEVSEEVD